ncbi:MAG: tRNA (N6-isopentenyl adenosine(37)-C2)-methylthiotransferase MiaB [Clostridia bacterium]|nr:tRNA (N6-isopentenyl adenosine(37)-C2)-methylthiotransferase MiaB [Clostridia bacterium]
MEKAIRHFDREADISAVRSAIDGQNKKYRITTFGCQQNEADGEKIAGLCLAMGYLPAENDADADLIVFNTCAIRARAEEKALSLLGVAHASRRGKEETVYALLGCMAAEKNTVESIKTSFPYVSFTLEPSALDQFPSKVLETLQKKKRSFVYGEDDGSVCEGIPQDRKDPVRPFVSVMYGCNNFCSYCIVPYVRGRERSRNSADVLAEIRSAIENGGKEITLLGQNVNSYHADMTFPQLTDKAAGTAGDFVLKFMTSHPKDLSDELIAVMAKHRGKIAPVFHLPLQSGSDRILKAMNRTYTREAYLTLVEKLRAAIPDIAVTTDIIVGFPGETEEDFLDTMDIVARVKYDNMYPFIYSTRTGTVAAKMENQIPHEISAERMDRLLALSRTIAEEKAGLTLGRDYRVLVDSFDGENKTCRGKLPSGLPISFEGTEDLLNTFVFVTVTRTTPFALFGKIKV